MDRDFGILRIAMLATALSLPVAAAAQAPPKTAQPVVPKGDRLDPKSCGDNGATVGQGGEVQTAKAGRARLKRTARPIRRRHLSAAIRRSGDQGADAAGRFDAGHSAAGQPGWRIPQYSAEMTPTRTRLLDRLSRPFLYPPHSGRHCFGMAG